MRAARSQFTLLSGNGQLITAGMSDTVLGHLAETLPERPVGHGTIPGERALPPPRGGRRRQRPDRGRRCYSGRQHSTNTAEYHDITASPQGIAFSDVRGAAAIDPLAISGRATELWSTIYHPNPIGNFSYPIIVMLHGNHGTCGTGSQPRIDDRSDYTTTGQCPANYVVTPNQAGYGYIAQELAKANYIVVSINANRGLTGGGASGAPPADCPSGTPNCDPSLILARGKLVLRHLQRLSEWNRGVTTPPGALSALVGKMNFQQVGLMGHSRGGGGVRAAYALYNDASTGWQGRIGNPVTFRGIFEIGPTDSPTPGRTLNAVNVRSAVLPPMCDGDIRNLRGSWVLDRSFLEG